MNTYLDYDYIDILEYILDSGYTVQGRNGNVRTVLNQYILVNVNDSIDDFPETKNNKHCLHTYYSPILNVRKVAWKNALREMEWFLSGSNSINDLHESVRHWWKPWCDEHGNIKYNYAQQFTNAYGRDGHFINQIDYVTETLINTKHSRRAVMTTWNTSDMSRHDCKITSCHGTTIMFNVTDKDELYLTMVQRSADMMLGVPHNIAQYYALGLYIAHKTGTKFKQLYWSGINCHVYENHLDTAKKIVDTYNETEQPYSRGCKLIYTPTSDKFKAEDFTLDQPYKPLNKDKLELIV